MNKYSAPHRSDQTTAKSCRTAWPSKRPWQSAVCPYLEGYQQSAKDACAELTSIFGFNELRCIWAAMFDLLVLDLGVDLTVWCIREMIFG
jgi:hypothetical protein